MVDRTKAARLALYAMYAEDLFDNLVKDPQATNHGTPPFDTVLTDGTRLSTTDWEIVGEIRAADSLYIFGVHLPDLFGAGEYNYGFLLKRLTEDANCPIAKGQFLAMIRGTEKAIEFFDDVTIGADTITLDNGVKADAWKGFYSIYNTMELARGRSRMLAAEGIAEAVGGATVTVVGHSLGAALATYLTYDLARQDIGRLGKRVSGWFFASPKPANQVFADRFPAVVSSYSVVNWQRDRVPDTPPPPFVPLKNVNNSVLILTPANTVAQPTDPLSLTCNHHAICYAQMLDPAVARDTHYGCFGAPVTT